MSTSLLVMGTASVAQLHFQKLFIQQLQAAYKTITSDMMLVKSTALLLSASDYNIHTYDYLTILYNLLFLLCY